MAVKRLWTINNLWNSDWKEWNYSNHILKVVVFFLLSLSFPNPFSNGCLFGAIQSKQAVHGDLWYTISSLFSEPNNGLRGEEGELGGIFFIFNCPTRDSWMDATETESDFKSSLFHTLSTRRMATRRFYETLDVSFIKTRRMPFGDGGTNSFIWLQEKFFLWNKLFTPFRRRLSINCWNVPNTPRNVKWNDELSLKSPRGSSSWMNLNVSRGWFDDSSKRRAEPTRAQRIPGSGSKHSENPISLSCNPRLSERATFVNSRGRK